MDNQILSYYFNMACTFELGTPLAWSCTQGELASLAGAFATDSRSAVSGGSAAVENEGAAAPVTPAVFEVITSRYRVELYMCSHTRLRHHCNVQQHPKQ